MISSPIAEKALFAIKVPVEGRRLDTEFEGEPSRAQLVQANSVEQPQGGLHY